MRPDQERVKNLLTDTVTLLCKNGLQYSKELKVQGLLGITLDNDDVFVVHINEIFEGLVGGQLAGITTETSAIAAADSATQPSEAPTKSRKATPHRHDSSRNSSPLQGSMKRKAFNRVHVKREVDDDLQVLNTKEDNFIPGATELSGDGDREAMRMSYGGLGEGPPSKKQAGDSGNTSDSFSDEAEHVAGGPFITGVAHSHKENESGDHRDRIDLDDSQGSGQPVFAPGCSDWDPSQGTADNTENSQANDSLVLDMLGHIPEASLTLIPHSWPGKRRSVHDPTKPFACEFGGCWRSFFRRAELNRHQREKHGHVHPSWTGYAPGPRDHTKPTKKTDSFTSHDLGAIPDDGDQNSPDIGFGVEEDGNFNVVEDHVHIDTLASTLSLDSSHVDPTSLGNVDDIDAFNVGEESSNSMPNDKIDKR